MSRMEKPLGYIKIARALELDVNGYQNYVVCFPRAKWLLTRNFMFEQNFMEKEETNMFDNFQKIHLFLIPEIFI